ncbi:MAG: hypothetical protein IT439_03445 [Phycisphaerales bacterium]|nr:hypothetical protein [Phycisphaerales bacterium]
MDFLTLWLPIVLTGVAVFVASSVIWMATPLHKKDYCAPPNEETMLAALREGNYAPGLYCLPWCAGANFKDPAFQEKLKRGPWAHLAIMAGPPSFGRCLAQWFAFQVVLALLIAYAAAAAISFHAGTPYLKVFQVVGATAFIAHASGPVCESIWRGISWRSSAVKMIDAVVYTLITAGIFASMWPRALAA